MRREVKKLYKGCIDLRDYDVRECITKNEPMIVMYNGERMTLSVEDLKTKVVSTSKLMKSSVGGKDYHLLSYEWIPDKVEL